MNVIHLQLQNKADTKPEGKLQPEQSHALHSPYQQKCILQKTVHLWELPCNCGNYLVIVESPRYFLWNLQELPRNCLELPGYLGITTLFSGNYHLISGITTLLDRITTLFPELGGYFLQLPPNGFLI